MNRYIDFEEEYNMNDLISRQDALDLVEKWFLKIGLNGDICLDGLRSLPSADVVSKEKYDELNERYHRLLESANILSDSVRAYERRAEDAEIH